MYEKNENAKIKKKFNLEEESKKIIFSENIYCSTTNAAAF